MVVDTARGSLLVCVCVNAIARSGVLGGGLDVSGMSLSRSILQQPKSVLVLGGLKYLGLLETLISCASGALQSLRPFQSQRKQRHV